MEVLDAGDPADLARAVRRAAVTRCRTLHVVGGCCGTDHRHVGGDRASAFAGRRPVS